MIHRGDNVAVALEPLLPATRVTVRGADEVMTIEARQEIPFAHKMAVRPISKGEAIVKHGVPIACATCDIETGDWVHAHNVASSFATQRRGQQR
jgi:hypothetical protein